MKLFKTKKEKLAIAVKKNNHKKVKELLNLISIHQINAPELKLLISFSVKHKNNNTREVLHESFKKQSFYKMAFYT